MMADWSLGKGRTSDEIVDFAWVNLKEVKKYDLIEGIGTEIKKVDAILNGKSPDRVKFTE